MSEILSNEGIVSESISIETCSTTISIQTSYKARYLEYADHGSSSSGSRSDNSSDSSSINI